MPPDAVEPTGCQWRVAALTVDAPFQVPSRTTPPTRWSRSTGSSPAAAVPAWAPTISS